MIDSDGAGVVDLLPLPTTTMTTTEQAARLHHRRRRRRRRLICPNFNLALRIFNESKKLPVAESLKEETLIQTTTTTTTTTTTLMGL